MRNGARPHKPAFVALLALVLVAAVPSNAAADMLIAPDPQASEVTALDGTVVWVTAPTERRRTLMRRTSGQIAPVNGAPLAADYRSIDLGHDEHNKLVLTYVRCDPYSKCKAYRDDLRGHRASFRGLTPTGCSLTAAPAMWRTTIGFGLSCIKQGKEDVRRSGLYVKNGSGTPRRLSQPQLSGRGSVDVRGSRVAAVEWSNGIAVVQDTNGTNRRSYRVGLTEGDTQSQVHGLALATTETVWTLTTTESLAPQKLSTISRLTGPCIESENISSATGQSMFPVIDIAVDGKALYLLVPGTGVTTHSFAANARLSVCAAGP